MILLCACCTEPDGSATPPTAEPDSTSSSSDSKGKQLPERLHADTPNISQVYLPLVLSFSLNCGDCNCGGCCGHNCLDRSGRRR